MIFLNDDEMKMKAITRNEGVELSMLILFCLRFVNTIMPQLFLWLNEKIFTFSKAISPLIFTIQNIFFFNSTSLGILLIFKKYHINCLSFNNFLKCSFFFNPSFEDLRKWINMIYKYGTETKVAFYINFWTPLEWSTLGFFPASIDSIPHYFNYKINLTQPFFLQHLLPHF